MESGIIIKGIGGFYYVEAADTIYECKLRGIFRKNKLTPFVGDHVNISLDQDGTCTVEEILPRKNFLIRPPISNIDQLIIVVSVCDPVPSTLIIDKIIAAAEDKGIEPIVVISKTDLQGSEWLREIYEKTGIPFYTISSATGEGISAVQALLNGKITAFTGNSGVGKSSLLTALTKNFIFKPAKQAKSLAGAGILPDRSSY